MNFFNPWLKKKTEGKIRVYLFTAVNGILDAYMQA